MKNTKDNKKWFSIVLAMWITIVISLIAILILEFIIPFSRNIKGVENGTVAYYWAYSWIEESIWDLHQKGIWRALVDSWMWVNATWSQFILSSTTSTIPPVWKWNSEYHSDWNRLDPNNPLQLALVDNSGNKIAVDFTNTLFTFRVPDINNDWDYTNDGTLSWSTEPIINWILSWEDTIGWWGTPVILNADNSELIVSNNINWWTKTPWAITIWWKNGQNLDWDPCTIDTFYKDTCWWVAGIEYNPTLKLSIIDELIVNPWSVRIPYIEYQIQVRNSSSNPIAIPGRYSQISTAWKSYWYKKTLDIKVPQTSTNQAFDFAVFQ